MKKSFLFFCIFLLTACSLHQPHHLTLVDHELVHLIMMPIEQLVIAHKGELL